MGKGFNWFRWRPFIQGAFLLLFFLLFLQTTYRGRDVIPYPVNLFLRFDPLILLTTLLSTHRLPVVLLPALSVVGLTLLLGRVFCGWICPLGTLNHLLSRLNRRPRTGPGGFRWKYYILFGLLASSLFTVQVVGYLDPLSLLIRSLTLAAEPLWNLAAHSAFSSLYEHGFKALEPLYAFLRAHLLALRQPLYHQAFAVGVIFAAVLLLNLLRPRFWCTHLCPLGALLGLVASLSPLSRRVSPEDCDLCGLCQRLCPSGAADSREGLWRKAECFLCGRCQVLCPSRAVAFGFSLGKGEAVEGMDLGRRRVLLSLAAGAVLAPLLRLSSLPTRGREGLIRPPGALPEAEFLRRCVRCGECMKVCLTGGLQPALLEAGLEGIWTPVFDFDLGYCQYYCTLCGQVCPTGAIQELTQAEKAKVKIGLAHIDRSRCIPYSQGVDCIVCEEHCPTPEKAIKFVLGEVVTPKGPRRVKLPVVDLRLCIGCGICQFKCPLEDKPAIVVTPLGETRGGAFLLPT